MRKIIFLFFSCGCIILTLSCNNPSNEKPVEKDTRGADVDSIYSNLSRGRQVQTQRVVGSFSYDSTHKDGYTATFYSDEFNLSMRYLSYPNKRKDEIFIYKKSFKIDSKFDPLSVTAFWIQPNGRKIYLLLEGKPQSASGSGNQVTYFCLIQLEKDSSIKKHFEFQSRFGTLNNILDYDSDGEPDYFKIENSNRLGEYRLTIHHILDSAKENTQFLLRRTSDDKFAIIDSSSTNK